MNLSIRYLLLTVLIAVMAQSCDWGISASLADEIKRNPCTVPGETENERWEFVRKNITAISAGTKETVSTLLGAEHQGERDTYYYWITYPTMHEGPFVLQIKFDGDRVTECAVVHRKSLAQIGKKLTAEEVKLLEENSIPAGGNDLDWPGYRFEPGKGLVKNGRR